MVATKYPGVYVLSTTDYFYPSVEDPILQVRSAAACSRVRYAFHWTSAHIRSLVALHQGRIACCNVVSDLYAMGVTEIDTMLMLLTVRVEHDATALLSSNSASQSVR